MLIKESLNAHEIAHNTAHYIDGVHIEYDEIAA